MRKNVLFGMGLVLAGCVGGAGELGTAGEALTSSQNYQFRGEAASGYFGGSSPDGCGYWYGQVQGGESVSHTVGGAPVSGAYSYAYVYGYNRCTGENFSGWGSAESATIDGLNSAHFSVPVAVTSNVCTFVDCAGSSDPRCEGPPPCDPATDPFCCDPMNPRCGPPPGYWECTYETTTGNFVADLTGEGDTYRGRTMSNYSAGTYRSVSRDNGSSRGATLTGSLLVGGRDLLAGAFGYGSIQNNNSSSHTFYRY